MSHRESDFDCPQCVDAAAYVLGALEESELARYREHLETCAHCRAEVAELQTVVDVLPTSAPPAVASEALRERILATVRSEAELLRAAAGEHADRPSRPVSRLRARRFSLLGASAGLAATAAVIVAILLGSSSGGSLIVDKGHSEANARGADVSLRRRDGHAELVVAKMPQPALGKIYEVWLSRGAGDAEPTNALFSVTSAGSGSVDVPNSLHGVKEVMVTSEPSGGSDHPTSPRLLRVVLSS
jgi:anti-sigma factor RsiW